MNRTLTAAAVMAFAVAASTVIPGAPGPRFADAEPNPARAVPKDHRIEPNSEWEPWMLEGPSDLTMTGMAALALAVGCTPANAVVLAAIGEAESHGRLDAIGDTTLTNATWDESVSWPQIRGLVDHRGTGDYRDAAYLLTDGWAASWSAAIVSEGCQTFTPWTTYKTGDYTAHIPAAVDAVLWVVGVEP